MLEQSDNEQLKDLLTKQKEEFKKSLGIIYPWIVNEVRVRPRLNSTMQKAILHQFQVNDVKRFGELIIEDLYEEDKILFEKLNLLEHGNRIPRLESRVGRNFCYHECVLNLLQLVDLGLSLDDARVCLAHENYDRLLQTYPYEPVFVDNVLHLYGIPILTDFNRPLKHRSVPKNLFVATSDKISSKLYRDEIKVTIQQEINNLYLIESFRAVVPDLKPFKFYTIKIS